MANNHFPAVKAAVRVWLQWFDKQSRLTLTCMGLLAALVVGVLDNFAGHELSISILYLMPVTFCTWHTGRRNGVFMAAVSTIVLLSADLIDGVPYEHSYYAYWNAGVLFGSFLVVVYLLSSLRMSKDRLEEMVDKRTAALRTEVAERKRAEEQLLKVNAELALKQKELLLSVDELQKSHAQLKVTQMQLVESAKMETLGRLSAGVVHEVKNPLSVLRLGVDYLLRQSRGKDNDTAQMLGDMQHAVQQASSVVGELLALGRNQEMTMEMVNVHDVLDSALALLRAPLADASIKVTRDLGSNLPPLRLDRRKIEQVFINLVMNAIHAMADGGTLTVRTRVKQLDPAEVIADNSPESDSLLRPGDTVVVVEIDDAGSGIPEDKLSKVFDPFFTTKPEGKGTGLGLTVCKTIISVHGGALNLRNRPEGGVRASITFKA